MSSTSEAKAMDLATNGVELATPNHQYESDEEEEQEISSHAHNIRTKQIALFNAWLNSPSTQKKLASPVQKRTGYEGDIKIGSTHDILSHSHDAIVKNARDYQLELFARAKERNTIAVLDTGSGKTLIAILLLRWIYEQELERGAKNGDGKISFYLVSSVTLAYQQYSVLEKNLDFEIARVCGTDNVDQWNRQKWAKLFADHKVIVCTADILQQCLAHGHMHMHRINLMVFDEAHHTKKNHAYARIMKDFYVPADVDARPRIFSMTASPVDGNSDIDHAAHQLESLLHSEILTVANMSLSGTTRRPSERVVEYMNATNALPDSHTFRIVQNSSASSFVHKCLPTAKSIFKHLGPWCANEYLIDCCTGRMMKEFVSKIEREFSGMKGQTEQDITTLDQRIAELQNLRAAVAASSEQRLGPRKDDLSTKVQKLQDILTDLFEQNPNYRCIVFVQERNTAILLNKVFTHVHQKFMRPGSLVGINSHDADCTVTYRQQILSLTEFRKGQTNCLFATSVAEEGLDVPDCNAVIRFDLYSTMIQYVQSRGRARQPDSVYIHMMEKDNSLHRDLHERVHDQERDMRNFIKHLPADRLLSGHDSILEGLLEGEANLKVYTEPVTSARLTFGTALGCLANFVSTIPQQNEEACGPVYSVRGHGQLFVAEVLLPANAPFRSCVGHPQKKKTLAKRSAAFEACVQLRNKEFLDEHLLPIYKDRLPRMANALLAVGLEKKDRYPMKLKPSLWADSRGAVPTILWATLIDFPAGLGSPRLPIMLLTRSKMPQFPLFQIFPNDGRAADVYSVSMPNAIAISPDSLIKLTKFTLCVFADIFSKLFQENMEDLSYWFAPMRPTTINADLRFQTLDNVLDWSTLDTISEPTEKWTPCTQSDTLVDKLIVDPSHGGLKYYSKRIATHLKPYDCVPEGSRIIKAKSTDDQSRTIASNSSPHFSHEMRKFAEDVRQPVIEAEILQMRRNVLACPVSTPQIETAYICPAGLHVSKLPLAYAITCEMLPGIIHRFESYLIAWEACKFLNIECNLDLALAALTNNSRDDSSQDEETPPLRLQDGMGDNYERLEFLGDTFLKFATTLAVFVHHPDDDEFESHVNRMVMLCNKTLYNSATRIQLYQHIRSRPFSRRTWYPEGLTLLKGKKIHPQGEHASTHALSKKTLADVCEALIGAAFLSHDKPGAWTPTQWQHAISAVTLFVDNDDHKMMKWEDYRAAYRMLPTQTTKASAVESQLVSKVSSRDAYTFQFPRLLRTAFTHPSMPRIGDTIHHYERLEFLGDALLDMVAVSHLYNRFPDRDEHWLTEHKMAVISNKFLGVLCVQLGFHQHLRVCSPEIPHQITEFVTELEAARVNLSDAQSYWLSVSNPPKYLADVVEAYVGALFIDSDFDYNQVQRFFDQHMAPHFGNMALYDEFANEHPYTRLQNLFQKTLGCNGLSVMTREIPSVLPSQKKQDFVAVVIVHDTILVDERGESPRYTKTRVAKTALKMMDGIDVNEFKSTFSCDCGKEAKDN